ncbi:lipocalin family protein [Chryseolinea lacunae]|uniref:Lipocalin family protein n=1 Tax=Chryseolinea lacunae TaxID=2801331 RepID=A0ABS1KRH9_9BACT|nr:lipocalin family protein [Chryseolinea lacunae]MBL0740886.1 lipocalin family protein [Chryseolinea lacunae]
MTSRIASLLSFVLLITCTMFSCKDEDKTFPSVVGKWQGTSASANITLQGVPVPFDQTDDDFDAIVEFKADGTATITDDGVPSTGTWSQNNDKLTVSLTFSTDFIDLSGTYTIKELTDSKLVIYIEKQDNYTDPDTQIEVSGTIKATINFEKKV